MLTLGSGGVAYAAQAHVFDPALSLTGDCSTSPPDTVPDPAEPPCPEEAEGTHPPSGSFSEPTAVATDAYGDIYVASAGGEAAKGAEGRIDIFDSSGFFIAELKDEFGPRSIAIDSEGNLYVTDAYNALRKRTLHVGRYAPTIYKPAEGKIAYEGSPVTVIPENGSIFLGLAVDSADDHLFVKIENHINEYESAVAGGGLVEEFGSGQLSEDGVGIAVDSGRGRIYASTRVLGQLVVKVFELKAPHTLLSTIEGSAVPAGKFVSNFLSLAVDEGTGNLFIYDGQGNKVYELDQGGTYLSTIEHGFKYVYGSEIGVDNGENSINGALNPFGRYLFVPSSPSQPGHSFAFGSTRECEPKIDGASFTGVTESEAELQADINPCGLPTEYTFEYTTEESFEEEGFAGAQVAGEGQIPAGLAPVLVSAVAAGLTPETAYRFRVFAENEKGSIEAEREFATYPSQPLPVCPNDALRTGFSALLPDCRAYELVTPPETNARAPRGALGATLGVFFASREASPEGGAVSFLIEGGSVPGSESTGSLNGDPYRASRGDGGWSTAYVGPSGFESPGILPGSHSPDQGYSFWRTNNTEGSAAVNGENASYVRYPDGHSELVGRGSLGSDPKAVGRLISQNGGHIVFTSTDESPAVQLEPNAPPDGTRAIYDRTPDEVTHVVSLLPGGITPAAGENAFYEGASLDGKGVAFRLGEGVTGGPLYLRYDNKETYEIAEEATFAGVAEGGARIFYLKGGDLYRFDALNEETTRFTTSGDVTVVNVSADGAVAYFVSPSVLTGEEKGPNGEVAQKGQENLYLSRGETISFVATLTEADVAAGKDGIGLEMWVPHVISYGEVAEDPSRTTSDGTVLLFESRADLAGYDPEGHVEVYRFDASADELDCLSCNPTKLPAGGNASLQSVSFTQFASVPLGPFDLVPNLRPDGRRAFFQSTEPLVSGDVDGLQDVYEWEAKGVGSCTRPSGCVYLISSGQSSRPDYLYSVSDNGDDVFFRSADLLLRSDAEETSSIYDARVGGGFPEERIEPCEGEGCRPALSPPPASPNLGSMSVGPSTNLPAGKCPKGERRVKRSGKTRCVKKHHKHRHRASGAKNGVGK